VKFAKWETREANCASWGVAHLKGRRLALAEETFLGLCESATKALGLGTSRAVA
jgi:hypothetical protein